MIFGLPGLIVIGGGMAIAYYLATHVTVQPPGAPGSTTATGSTPTTGTLPPGATNPNPGAFGVSGIPFSDATTFGVNLIEQFQPDNAAGNVQKPPPGGSTVNQ